MARVAATSPTIVLLHGLGDSANIWRALMAAEILPYPTIAFDLPGHGASLKFTNGYDIDRMVAALCDAVAEQRLQRFVLVGHSLGARLAIELGSQAQFDAATTIMVEPSVKQTATGREAIRAHLQFLRRGATSREELERLVEDRLPLSDSLAVSMMIRSSAILEGGRWRLPFDPEVAGLLVPTEPPVKLSSLVSKLRCPVGLIRGAYSGLLDRATQEQIALSLPGNCVHVDTIERAGHAIPLEQPAALARSILRCLNWAFPIGPTSAEG